MYVLQEYLNLFNLIINFLYSSSSKYANLIGIVKRSESQTSISFSLIDSSIFLTQYPNP
jgi:hypothetical protein